MRYVCPSLTYALGLIVFFAHSWLCKRKTWFSEVMVFIVWHHKKQFLAYLGFEAQPGLPCDSFSIHPGLYACLPAHSHESLIPFELSNARVTFHQPAHSAELHQLLLCKASHSHSQIDLVLATFTKIKEVKLSASGLLLRHDTILIPSDFLSWGWWSFQGFVHIIPHLIDPAILTLHHW